MILLLLVCFQETATLKVAFTKMCEPNYLASPPLVVAYALAGTVNFDFETEPLLNSKGEHVYLRDILAF